MTSPIDSSQTVPQSVLQSTQLIGLNSSLNQLKNLDKLPKIKVSNSAKTTILVSQIEQFVISEIQKLPNYQSLSTDSEIYLHILSTVLHLINNNDSVDAKGITIDIIKQLFPSISTEQMIIIDNVIDFFINNNLSKKITTLSKVSDTVTSVLKKIS